MGKLAFVDPRVPALARSLSAGNSILADDITQMVNEELIGGCSLYIARYRVIDQLRTKAYSESWKNRIPHIWYSDLTRLEETNPDAVRSNDAEDKIFSRLEIESILADLSPDNRQFLILKYIHGWTYVELAILLGESADSLRKKSSKLIQQLRNRFAS